MDTLKLNQDFVKQYTRRVAAASPTGLVVITYELILSFIQTAIAHEAGSEDQRAYLERAGKGVRALMAGLDFSQAIAQDLFSLYLYIHQKLIEGAAHEAADLLSVLLEGWRAVEDPIKPQAVRCGFIRRGRTWVEYEEQEGRAGFQA